MKRVSEWVAGHPFLVLGLVAGVTLLALSQLFDLRTGAFRLRIDASVNRMIPDADEDRLFYEEVRARFGSDETIVLALVADHLFSADKIARVRRLTKRLQAIEGVESVLSLATALDVRPENDDLVVAPFLENVGDDPDALEGVARRVAQNPIYAGTLVSKDGRATAFVISLSEMSERTFVERGIEAQIERAGEEERGDAEVWITGSPVIKQVTARTLLSDLSVIIPAAFGLTLLVALLSFRSVRGVVIPLVCVSLGIVWTLATMVWLERPLNLVTVIVPPLLLTVGYAYAMHLLAEYYDLAPEHPEVEPKDRRALVGVTLRAVGLPIFVCGMTTVVGFASLTMSPLSAIQEFGAFSVLGTLFIVFATLTFGPALLSLLRVPKPRTAAARGPSFLDRFSETVGRFAVRNRYPVFLGTALAVALALVGLSKIVVTTNLIDSFDPDSRVRRDFEAVNEHLGGANTFYVVVDGPADAFKEPVNLRALRDLQDWLEAQPGIGSTTSVADFLMLLNRAFHDDDPAKLEIPATKRITGQLLAFAGGNDLERFLDPRAQTAIIVVRAKGMDSAWIASIVERLDARAKSLPEGLKTRVTGSLVLLAKTVDSLAGGQVTSLLTGFVMIYVVLSLMFMSLRVGFLALIPNAFPVVAYFGLMGFSGVSLNVTTGLVACIVLGIAVDDTIHFMHRFNTEAKRLGSETLGAIEAQRVMGRPVTLTAIATTCGFGVLCLSQLASQRQFGALAAATLALGWVCEMFLTPALCAGTRLVTLWDLMALDLGDSPQHALPFFHGLSERQAKIAALMMSVVAIPSATRLITQGESGDDVFVVIEGEFEASIQGERSRQVLRRMRRGDVIGEVGLFYGKRSADVDAISDARVVKLGRRDLEKLRSRYPRIAAQVLWNLSNVLAARLAGSSDQLRSAWLVAAR